MESHVKWGMGFIALGIILELLIPFLFLVDTALIVLGITFLIFRRWERK